MSARRPYASRGVPRRITTLRRGRPERRVAATILAVVVLAVGAAFVATHVIGTPPPPVAGNGVGQAPQAAFAPLAASAAERASRADAPAAQPTITRVSTMRQWDASAPGISVDSGLIDRLDQALLGVDGRLSVAVKDLGSNRGAALNGSTELPAASLYKLAVLDAVFAVGLSMNEELPITEEARSYDSGTMELGVGETLTVSEALERMIVLSDNTSAITLGGRVGSGRVNATIDALGLEATHYSVERMTTSSLDMLHVLEVIARGRAVSPAASADMLHLLLRQRVNDRLPRLLPDDVQVAHKTGNLPGTVNDVGILYGPTTTIAIAALVADTADEATAALAIARLALAANTYFEAQSEIPGRPTIPPAPARAIPPVWRVPRPVPTPTPPRPEPQPTPEVDRATPPAVAPGTPPAAGAGVRLTPPAAPTGATAPGATSPSASAGTGASGATAGAPAPNSGTSAASAGAPAPTPGASAPNAGAAAPMPTTAPPGTAPPAAATGAATEPPTRTPTARPVAAATPVPTTATGRR